MTMRFEGEDTGLENDEVMGNEEDEDETEDDEKETGE